MIWSLNYVYFLQENCWTEKASENEEEVTLTYSFQHLPPGGLLQMVVGQVLKLSETSSPFLVWSNGALFSEIKTIDVLIQIPPGLYNITIALP